MRQVGGSLQFAEDRGAPGLETPGSALAGMVSTNGLVTVGPAEAEPDTDSFWPGGLPPSWADKWGWDEFGGWASFSVTPAEGGARVTQRMRWISPGRFLMGSPDNEPERYAGEGPQHPVRLASGFWLFDTACTQALWQAVMGKNPSHFQGENRPVEQVSWDATQRFIMELNARVPGLDLALPSEAQWEYACRAGTVTSFFSGKNIDPEQVNYNGEYPYPGGKKGKYRAETVPVGSLPPNAWGLYEMQGNVWEWVQDEWHGNYQGAPEDGRAWEQKTEGRADRVIRGGSWYAYARLCRCASRYWYSPDDRYIYLGFRCARVQDREPGKPAGGAERANLGQPGPRSGSGRDAPGSLRAAAHRDGGSEAAAVRDVSLRPETLSLEAVSQASLPLPQVPALRILTDRDRLTLRRATKPGWASAMGRDAHGLWAEFEVAREGRDPVTQRLRWIPPGRFLMGSPEEETRGLAKTKEEKPWFEAEHPRHSVVLSTGYWLFDTPCTQALWEVVMENNPSQFVSPRRPVEKVTWDDVQGFLGRLNKRIPGLNLVLPSEAQWEYACRAGTDTALYSGPIEILGQNNASALDPIAWYGGNSGVDFDLAEGEDCSGWPEKQYPSKLAGTRNVGEKLPNPWGLHDMLGNVWEWVQDTWHESYKGAPDDGQAWESEGEERAARVVRGGSWSTSARNCRCAARGRLSPDDRDDDLGFRCARVQES